MKSTAGERTLLASVLLSSPGPIVLGLALVYGRSSTQLADFIRRSAELIAIIVSYLVFRQTQKPALDWERRVKTERLANLSVGAAMCLSGPVIFVSALVSSRMGQGNVVPGLVIAGLGLVTNAYFYLRYHRLNQMNANAILAVQSRLYRAKSLVDACVTAALTAVVIAPGATLTQYVDLAGSIIVAVYLIVSGISTIWGKQPRVRSEEKVG